MAARSVFLGRGAAELREVRIHRYDADYRSTARLVVTAEFGYPAHELLVRYEICCYPGAPGVRTRLYVKGMVPFDPDLRPKHLIGAYTESLALPAGTFERIAFGYYSDTQHRCHRNLPILKEKRASGPIGRGEVFDFANGLILCEKDGSAVLVKESHKYVNNSGVDTGEFILHADGVRVTGLGLAAAYEGPWFGDREFRGCWAGWCIVCSGGEAEARRALKEFDRARFPFRTEKAAPVFSAAARMAEPISRSSARRKRMRRPARRPDCRAGNGERLWGAEACRISPEGVVSGLPRASFAFFRRL